MFQYEPFIEYGEKLWKWFSCMNIFCQGLLTQTYSFSEFLDEEEVSFAIPLILQDNRCKK
jgi:hypothetical protein